MRQPNKGETVQNPSPESTVAPSAEPSWRSPYTAMAELSELVLGVLLIVGDAFSKSLMVSTAAMQERSLLRSPLPLSRSPQTPH